MLKIDNLTNEIEMTAVRGGSMVNTNQSANVGAYMTGPSVATAAGGYGLVGPITIVTAPQDYVGQAINVSTPSITDLTSVTKYNVNLFGSSGTQL